MSAPVSRSARLEDQLQLDDEVNSEIAGGYTVGSSARHRTAVGDLPTSSVSAVQLVLSNKRVLRKYTPRVVLLRLKLTTLIVKLY